MSSLLGVKMDLIWTIVIIIAVLLTYDYFRSINPEFSATVKIKELYGKVKDLFVKKK